MKFCTSIASFILSVVVVVTTVLISVTAEDDTPPASSPFLDAFFPTAPLATTTTTVTPSAITTITTTSPDGTILPTPAIVPSTPSPSVVGGLPTTPSPSGEGVETTLPSITQVDETPMPPSTLVPSAPLNETTSPPTITMTPTVFRNASSVVTLDCTLAVDGIDIQNDGSLLLRHIINPINGTVTVELVYTGVAWVSFGFANTTKMFPNVAVIGLPDENTVLRYDMISYALEGVIELPSERQTLMDGSISQENDVTTLRFTQLIDEAGEIPIVAGGAENTYIWAYGTSNAYGPHLPSSRGGTVTVINECLEIGETSSPTVQQTIAPTASPVTRMPVVAEVPTEPVITDGLDCSFQNPIDILGDGLVTLSQVVNPINETVTIELVYIGSAWVSFGFSLTKKMYPNIAVIGLPDEQTVLKYDMTSYALEGVVALPEDQQTLIDKSITQDGVTTTLRFTQRLDDLVGVPVDVGTNMYIWAYGIGNPLETGHLPTGRGDATVTLTECLAVGETSAPIPAATESPTASPTVAKVSISSEAEIIDLGNGRKQRFLSLVEYPIDFMFITDEPMQTITIEMTYEGIGYVSVAFSEDVFMPNSLAVMAIPADGTNLPSKYDMLAGKGEDDVVMSPSDRQTLTDHTYSQNATHTRMIFTKILSEGTEQEVFLTGINNILWAVGEDNKFANHFQGRGAFAIDFSVAGVETASAVSYKSWWIVHGILLAIAWVILVPVAVVASILKSYLSAMPAGCWYRTHRNLNTIGVLFTIIGFGISVFIVAKENGGSDAVHFKTSQHHKIGLVVFLFAFLQAVSGFFRPHLPHKPDPIEEDDDENDDEAGTENKVKPEAPVHHELRKSPQRIFFEYQHRILGALTMILGWINCASGFEKYYDRFEGPELVAAVWAVVVTIVLATVVLAIYDRAVRQSRS